MIYENVELHNIEEVRSIQDHDGVRLQRIREDVRLALNEGAQMRMLQPDSAEIRFVADDSPCRITLSSEGQSRVTVFNGLFDSRQRFIIGPEPQTIELVMNERLPQLDKKYWSKMSFSPRVYRVILGGPQREPVFFHGLEGQNIRPPEANEIPSLRYLAYGTSITHGFDAEGPHLSYAGQTARRLGADLINLGVGGSAHCEPELADYISAQNDWHIATLALSVNMQGFELSVFRDRVGYMVNKIAGTGPKRPVACITLYPHYRDFGIELEDIYGGRPEEYRQILRDVVQACPYENVHLIEGPEILTDISGLTADLIHPADNGMIEMGWRLAEKLKPLLPS
ncbi:MAG: hypothetical protein GWP14_07030 [Actinobacteria bacterium]|nr:hypothetical protein [Actinomycetota bacterium]